MKAKATDLLALLTRVEKREITTLDAMMAAYMMGHADAMTAWQTTMQAVIEKWKVAT